MHESKIHCLQPDSASLNCYQTYRTTTESAARVKAHAAAAGVSVSELTRLRMDNLPPPVAAAPQVNLDLYAALNHTTTNFNQATKNSNLMVLKGQREVIDFAIFISLLKKMDVQVNALRSDLIGASSPK